MCVVFLYIQQSDRSIDLAKRMMHSVDHCIEIGVLYYSWETNNFREMRTINPGIRDIG